jgi:hypothetical protein
MPSSSSHHRAAATAHNAGLQSLFCCTSKMCWVIKMLLYVCHCTLVTLRVLFSFVVIHMPQPTRSGLIIQLEAVASFEARLFGAYCLWHVLASGIHSWLVLWLVKVQVPCHPQQKFSVTPGFWVPPAALTLQHASKFAAVRIVYTAAADLLGLVHNRR